MVPYTWKQRMVRKAHRLALWFIYGGKKTVTVTWGTFWALGFMDTLVLIATWLVTRPLTLMLIGLQSLLYGDFPSIWTTEGAAKGLVLLIPGYTYTRRQLLGIARRLHRKGLIVARAAMPPNGNTLNYAATVALNEGRLQDVAWYVTRSNGVLPVAVVGHSYGGSCGIRMAERLGELMGKPVSLVVTVQTPIRGTRLAQFGDFPAAMQMSTERAEVGHTIAAIERLQKAGVLLKYFCAFWDEVCRRRDSRPPLNGNTDRWAQVLPHVGHWGTFQNPFALDEIVGFVAYVLNGNKNH